MSTWVKWSPVFVLGAVWTAAWTLAWQRYLFDSLGTPPGYGLTILLDDRGSSHTGIHRIHRRVRVDHRRFHCAGP